MTAETLQVAFHNPQQAAQAMHALVSPWCRKQFEGGHAVHVELRLLEDVKTDRQRRYYHGVVLKTIAEQARINGQGFDLKTWKEYFRNSFLGFKTITYTDPIAGKKRRRRHRISTEDLGIRAYARLIDQVIAFAASELGVIVPTPFTEWDAQNIDPETGEILGGRFE